MSGAHDAAADALGLRIDAALRDLDAIRSSDPAASTAMLAVRLTAHTLRCHAPPGAPEVDDRAAAG